MFEKQASDNESDDSEDDHGLVKMPAALPKSDSSVASTLPKTNYTIENFVVILMLR